GGFPVSASSSSHFVSSNHRSFFRAALLVALPLVSAIPACASKPVAPPKENAEKIGVYDSRAVAIAWVGTEELNRSLDALRKEADQARVAGDRERAAALNRDGAAMQERLHLQGFSTASVDDILARIQDRLPEIEAKTGTSLLVSKWDEAALAQHVGAERVDVTEPLVDALRPNDLQRTRALGIVKTKPIPLA